MKSARKENQNIIAFFCINRTLGLSWGGEKLLSKKYQPPDFIDRRPILQHSLIDMQP